jgi:hypothetical protein
MSVSDENKRRLEQFPGEVVFLFADCRQRSIFVDSWVVDLEFSFSYKTVLLEYLTQVYALPGQGDLVFYDLALLGLYFLENESFDSLRLHI